MDAGWAERVARWAEAITAIEKGRGELGIQNRACACRDDLEQSLRVADGAEGHRLAALVAGLDARYRRATKPLPGVWGDAPWWWRREPRLADWRPEQARGRVGPLGCEDRSR